MDYASAQRFNDRMVLASKITWVSLVTAASAFVLILMVTGS